MSTYIKNLINFVDNYFNTITGLIVLAIGIGLLVRGITKKNDLSAVYKNKDISLCEKNEEVFKQIRMKQNIITATFLISYSFVLLFVKNNYAIMLSLLFFQLILVLLNEAFRNVYRSQGLISKENS